MVSCKKFFTKDGRNIGKGVKLLSNETMAEIIDLAKLNKMIVCLYVYHSSNKVEYDSESEEEDDGEKEGHEDEEDLGSEKSRSDNEFNETRK